MTPARATLAIDVGSSICGYAVQYPGGMKTQGEYGDHVAFLDVIDGLLQNGLKWRMVVAVPSIEYINGALWYLAAKNGADFSERALPPLTDGQLRNAGWWRRGLGAANRAARLLLTDTIEGTE